MLPLPTLRQRQRRHFLGSSKRRRPVNAMAVDAMTVVDCARDANALVLANLKSDLVAEGRRRVKRVIRMLVWTTLVDLADPAVVAEIRRHLAAAVALLLQISLFCLC